MGETLGDAKMARVSVRALLIALACVAIPVTTWAETADSGLSDYYITTWSEKDGLPPAGIRSLEPGAEGDLWLGTETGLVRFDGLRFVPFERLQQGRLPAGAVSTLMRVRDGSLWVGLNGTPSLARVKSGRVTTFSESDGIADGQVTSLYEDRRGTIWAGSVAGLFRFDGRRWARVVLPDSGRDAVAAIREDTAGGLWAVGPLAVFRRPAIDAAFEVVERVDVASNVWQSLSMDREGRMWMTDFGRGVRLLGDRVTQRPPGKGRAWGVQILHDSRATMWVATRGQGLWRIADAGASRAPIVITSRDGLVSDAVQAVLEDRDGNIWIGTAAGLQRLSPHRVTPRRDLGVVRVLETTPDGSVWVGTSEGLSRITSSGRRPLTAADGLPGAVVLTLHADRAGGLWVATECGVARYAGGRFTSLNDIDPTMQRVFAVATTRPGDVWLRDFLYRLYHWRDGAMELVTVIRQVHVGNRPVAPAVEAQLESRRQQPPLTPREIQVVRLIADGLRNKEIAVALGISEQTAKVHVKNILAKLRVNDRAAVIAVAARRGIFHL